MQGGDSPRFAPESFRKSVLNKSVSQGLQNGLRHAALRFHLDDTLSLYEYDSSGVVYSVSVPGYLVERNASSFYEGALDI